MPRPLPEALYHAAARARRRWFARHPEARRTLAQPVVSVGNLTFGGSGKTPIVAAIARALRDRGERPAVLSRGYRRRRAEDGVVLVSDGDRVLADLDRAGDEPLMLARSLEGVIVAVGPDRYLAGRLAELHCGATVHLLDDGFQHLALTRDVDLVVINGTEQPGSGVPLRENLETAMLCDALLVLRGSRVEGLPPKPAFHWWRQLYDPIDINESAEARLKPRTTYEGLPPVAAFAGIASPGRFFDDLTQIGVDVRTTMTFPDHHPFSASDLAAIAERTRSAGCRLALTTEKDAMRLRRFRPLPLRILAVPLAIAFDPAEDLAAWLSDHLAYARALRLSAGQAGPPLTAPRPRYAA